MAAPLIFSSPDTQFTIGRRIKDREDLCDITIKISGQSICTHKVVLCVQNEVFSTMLTGGFSEAGKDTIDLSDSVQSAEALKLIIDYFYTGEIAIDKNNVIDVLVTASYLMLKDLMGACSLVMLRTLCPQSCLNYLRYAGIFGLKDLAKVCFDMVQCRFKDTICQSEYFLETDAEFLSRLIRMGACKFLGPADLREMLLHWMKYSPRERYKKCQAIIKLIINERLLDSQMKEPQAEVKETLLDANTLEEKLTSPKDKEEMIKQFYFSVIILDMVPIIDSSTEGDSEYKIMLYIPEQDQWYSYNKHMSGALSPYVVGFLQDYLVLRGNDKLLLRNLETSVSHSINIPMGVKSEIVLIDEDILSITNEKPHIVIRKWNTVEGQWETVFKDNVFSTLHDYAISSSEEYLCSCIHENTIFVCFSTCLKRRMLKITKESGKYKINIDEATDFPHRFENQLYKFTLRVHGDSAILTLQYNANKYIFLYNVSSSRWIETRILEKQGFCKAPFFSLPIQETPHYFRTDVDFDILHNHTTDKSTFNVYHFTRKNSHRKLCRMWLHCCGSSCAETREGFTRDQSAFIELTPPPISWIQESNGWQSKERVIKFPTKALRHFSKITTLPAQYQMQCPYAATSFQPKNLNMRMGPMPLSFHDGIKAKS